MKSLKNRLFLVAIASLLLAPACMADELVVVLGSATLDHDQRTGRPLLKLIFTETSKERLRAFGSDNIGQKVEYRIEGHTVIAPVLREPMSGTTQIISDNSWSDETVIGLAQQFSKSPKGEIELRPLPRSE
jgi:preprotein translocase subunit SecD